MTDGKLSLAARGSLAVIRAYQRYLSPRKPPVCRFTPTCSEYMVQAIHQYGALRGSWLGLKRIARCHPWSPGGYDPIPEPLPKPSSSAEPHR